MKLEDEAWAIEQANYLLLPGQTITVQSWDLDEGKNIILKKELPSAETEASADEAEDESVRAAEETGTEEAGTEKETQPKHELITQTETLRST